MERLVECGLSPLDAIRAATLNNAKALGIEGAYGTVEAGKAADLLVVNGDPAADISSVSNVQMVVQGGRIIVGPGRRE
jgi:imidazolonepropionase-like amidohydrolase